MADTPKLTLPLVDGAQTQKHVTHNEALERLDVLVQLNVIDRDLATPPGSPSTGDTYIVAGTATGDWTGQENNLAYWDGAAWAFIVPKEGWQAFIKDEDVTVKWDGTAWGGGAVPAHSHVIADVTSLQSELDGKADTGHNHDASYASLSRLISAAGLATGGGDLSADRTISVPKASQAEAEAGADDTKGMTPLKVKQAIDALASAEGITASSYGANGYVQFSDGLIIQWGSVDGSATATLPLTFPTAGLAAVVAATIGDDRIGATVGSLTTTQLSAETFDADTLTSSTGDTDWSYVAIGH